MDCAFTLRRVSPSIRRKRFTSSAPSHQCSRNVRSKHSPKQYERSAREILLSKRSWTVNESSCTNVEPSIFIARGEYGPIFCTNKMIKVCRKGKNYTYLYGRHVGEGSLTPFIDGAFDPRVHEYVSTVRSDNILTAIPAVYSMERCWYGILLARLIYLLVT